MEVLIARILIRGLHASIQHTVYAGIYLLSAECADASAPTRLTARVCVCVRWHFCRRAFAIRYDEYINILVILIYN